MCNNQYDLHSDANQPKEGTRMLLLRHNWRTYPPPPSWPAQPINSCNVKAKFESVPRPSTKQIDRRFDYNRKQHLFWDNNVNIGCPRAHKGQYSHLSLSMTSRLTMKTKLHALSLHSHIVSYMPPRGISSPLGTQFY